MLGVNKWISTIIANATEKMMKHKDERWISCAGELLAHIRTVKMCSWEKVFTQRLVERRELEVKQLAAVISSRRLSKYLSSPVKCSSAITASANLLKHQNTETNANAMAVILRNVCCNWSSSSIVESSMILRDISLEIQKGFFVAMIGEVGYGKSSLLNSSLEKFVSPVVLLPPMVQLHMYLGYYLVHYKTIFFLEKSLIQGGTFTHLNHFVLYEEVIHACTLDFDISAMVGGDTSHIGEKGLNLSGRQRARIALARALYHGSDVDLFDDILSSVVSEVASYILEKSIMGPK